MATSASAPRSPKAAPRSPSSASHGRPLKKTKEAPVRYTSAGELRKAHPGTPGAPTCKKCNCKKSQCLLNYCKCFAASVYCSDCACVSCQNKPEYEEIVKEARKTAKERDKNAFQPKFDPESPAGHTRGCRCRNVGCLKKYCECFSAGVRCGVNCGCQDCKNTDGHPDLMRALGLEPTVVKRPKYAEEVPQPVTRSTSLTRSVERSTMPAWLKGMLIGGWDRELVKAASSHSIPSNLPFGYVPAKKRSVATTVVDEEITPLTLKTLALDMVTAAHAAKFYHHDGDTSPAITTTSTTANTAAGLEVQPSSGGSASMPIATASATSDTSTASNKLSTTSAMHEDTGYRTATSSSSTTNASYVVGAVPVLSPDKPELASLAAQEAAILNVLEAQLRLLEGKLSAARQVSTTPEATAPSPPAGREEAELTKSPTAAASDHAYSTPPSSPTQSSSLNHTMELDV